MSQGIDYQARLQSAFRHMIADVLRDVATDGLPGDHHFYITFDTTHPGVEIAEWMYSEYPEEMTIVMQDWFDNLSIKGDRIQVTLNFREVAEPLIIPLEAVRTFVDPSVEFGLKFDPVDAPAPPPEPEPDPTPPPQDTPGDVVSLDAFRKS